MTEIRKKLPGVWNGLITCVFLVGFLVGVTSEADAGRSWAPRRRVSEVRLPAQETQETRVRSLGQEDHLQEETAACFSVLSGKIPRTEKPGCLQSMGSQRDDHGLSCVN